MRVSLQNALLITPIFLGLGLMIGLLVFASERREVIWGLNQEAGSLGVAVAEFIPLKDWKSESAFEEDGEGSITERLVFVLSQEQARYLRLYRPTTGAEWKVIWESGLPEYQAPVASERELALAAGRADYYENQVSRLTDGREVMVALIARRDQEGGIIGVVEVVTDASMVRERADALRWRILGFILVLGLVGFLISRFVSWLFTRRLNQLNEAVRIVASGDYQQYIGDSTIKEVGDLSNTFNTMSSVLTDVLSKTRQELIEAEQFRSIDDLSETCHRLCQSPIFCTHDDCRLLLQTAGKNRERCFIGYEEKEDGGAVAVLGQTRETEEFEAALIASAARTFFLSRLSTHRPENVVTEAMDHFDLDACLVVEIDKEGRVRQFSKHHEEIAIQHTPGIPVVLTTSDEDCESRIRSYIGLMGSVDPTELGLLLAEEDSVAVLVLEWEAEGVPHRLADRASG